MKRANRDVPLRVRVSHLEAARYRAAMEKLGLDEMSTFVRWALENSTVQVLGVEGAKKAVPAKPKARPAPRQAPAPKPPTPQAEPSLTALLGVPLFSTQTSGPQALVTAVDDDGWV